MKYYSKIKNSEQLIYTKTWMNLKNVMLNNGSYRIMK